MSILIAPDELIIDNFAGGGGASLGIEMALGRSSDIAINHDAEAIAMHRANHPGAKHYCENIRAVDPIEVCGGRPVGLAWFSPDCTGFSKAKGGKPAKKNIRCLARIAIHWARKVRPRVIILENVEEFKEWGPLLPNGRPCPERKGRSFLGWKSHLTRLGYRVECRPLRACDYGAPTIRRRLFVVARCDGLPIAWPDPTHGDPRKIGRDWFSRDLKPWRTAASCIGWSIPCPSIFERERPLAESTLRRIAAGIKRYVLDSPEPFIVNLTHDGGRVEDLAEPLRIITGANRGEKALVAPLVARIGQTGGNGIYASDIEAPLTTITSKAEHLLVAPFLAGVGGRAGQSPERPLDKPYQTITAKGDAAIIAPTLIQTGYGERHGQAPRIPGLDKPLGTAVGTVKHALVGALLKHYGGVVGSELEDPLGTVTGGGSGKGALVASSLVKLRGTCRDGQPAGAPMATISAQGTHIAEVRAFLTQYNSRSIDRFGLVTVRGEEFVIADIGLRMLTPRELFRAQGFSDAYIIDPIVKGKPLSKTAQVRMVGNSVAPPVAAAVAAAQFEGAAGRATGVEYVPPRAEEIF